MTTTSAAVPEVVAPIGARTRQRARTISGATDRLYRIVSTVFKRKPISKKKKKKEQDEEIIFESGKNHPWTIGSSTCIRLCSEDTE